MVSGGMSHKFTVDLGGLISLLSEHLYSRPDVFVRELLQNAIDACTARALHEAGRAPAAALKVRIGAPGEIEFEDEGVGLTEEEIHAFLATIGRSSKRRLTERPTGDFIGQFGIGLLACFVVSDEIEMVTRTAKWPGAPTLRWAGRADGTYAIETVADRGRPGTTVRLKAKDSRKSLFEPEAIQRSLKYFGRFLPMAIELTHDGVASRLDQTPPWRNEVRPARDRLVAFGQELFGTEFLDVIVLRSEVGGVEGLGFVRPHASVTGHRRSDRVYLKGMLLHDQVDALLPDWAFFIQAVLDVRDLRPVASREAFVEDEAVARVRQALGDQVKAYLNELANSEPERLAILLHLHHRPIKQLAEEDAEFLMLMARWLPFETSSGRMRLEEIIAVGRPVVITQNIDVFRQVAPFVEAQGRVAINGGYTHDYAIVRQFAEATQWTIEDIDANQLVEDFTDLTLEERRLARPIVEVADLALQPFKVDALVKHFSPATIPALYSASPDATFMRTLEHNREQTNDLWSGVLDDLATTRTVGTRAKFTLNFENPMVLRLTQVEDHELLRRLIEVLYVQTLLMGHHPLSSAEMNLVNESISGLIEWSLMSHDRLLQ